MANSNQNMANSNSLDLNQWVLRNLCSQNLVWEHSNDLKIHTFEKIFRDITRRQVFAL